MAARIAMMAMTTSSSINVNPKMNLEGRFRNVEFVECNFIISCEKKGAELRASAPRHITHPLNVSTGRILFRPLTKL